MGQGKDEVARTPAQIREEIARARAMLGEHLGDLSEPEHPEQGKSPGVRKMATKKVAAAKAGPRKSKSGTATKAAKGIAAKAGHTLDTMAAGAVVGAVKAAAAAIEEQESTRGRRKSSPSTGEVLGEMAPDLALGAVSGAAHAVLPPDPQPEKAKVAKSGKAAIAKKS
jgi:hypothetical protein